jgi:hypothetical protein
MHRPPDSPRGIWLAPFRGGMVYPSPSGRRMVLPPAGERTGPVLPFKSISSLSQATSNPKSLHPIDEMKPHARDAPWRALSECFVSGSSDPRVRHGRKPRPFCWLPPMPLTSASTVPSPWRIPQARGVALRLPRGASILSWRGKMPHLRHQGPRGEESHRMGGRFGLDGQGAGWQDAGDAGCRNSGGRRRTFESMQLLQDVSVIWNLRNSMAKQLVRGRAPPACFFTFVFRQGFSGPQMTTGLERAFSRPGKRLPGRTTGRKKRKEMRWTTE